MAKGDGVKVEVISELKIIDVKEGPWQYSANRIEVQVCVTCGAVIFDPILHWEWHNGS